MSDLVDLYPRFLMALCVWREARSESIAAMRGVVHVILNRVRDPDFRWRGDVVKVILQPQQFSSFNRDDPNASKFPIPGLSGGLAWQDSCRAVEQPGDDSTGGANMYHSGAREALPESQRKYFPAEKETARIGAFTFYKV